MIYLRHLVFYSSISTRYSTIRHWSTYSVIQAWRKAKPSSVVAAFTSHINLSSGQHRWEDGLVSRWHPQDKRIMNNKQARGIEAEWISSSSLDETNTRSIINPLPITRSRGFRERREFWEGFHRMARGGYAVHLSIGYWFATVLCSILSRTIAQAIVCRAEVIAGSCYDKLSHGSRDQTSACVHSGPCRSRYLRDLVIGSESYDRNNWRKYRLNTKRSTIWGFGVLRREFRLRWSVI